MFLKTIFCYIRYIITILYYIIIYIITIYVIFWLHKINKWTKGSRLKAGLKIEISELIAAYFRLESAAQVYWPGNLVCVIIKAIFLFWNTIYCLFIGPNNRIFKIFDFNKVLSKLDILAYIHDSFVPPWNWKESKVIDHRAQLILTVNLNDTYREKPQE